MSSPTPALPAEKSSLPDSCTPVPAAVRAAALEDWPEEELVRIRNVLRRLALLRVLHPEDAEDLVQETFLTMTLKCPQIELRRGLLVWGMGILHRKVGNYYRRGRRVLSLEAPKVREEAEKSLRQEPEALDLLRRAEAEGLLRELIGRLPAEERVVMELVRAGLSTGQIAECLVPERYQNVVNRIHRGRRKLGRALARRGYRTGRSRRRPVRAAAARSDNGPAT